MAKILIIDDDNLFRGMLVDLLAHKGHEILEASDGQTGFDLFLKTKPNLVITDILMPEKEGMQTIREIRKESPDTKIIALSGGGTHPDGLGYLQMALELGADHSFPKPFKTKEFLQTVDDLMAQ
jgi:YesN/AraC family two-component response regulator